MVIRIKTWVKILISVLLLALVYLVFHRITAEVVAVVAPAPSARVPVVVIDAGHGGQDGGAVGADGTAEKDLNLDIARRLSEFFEVSGYEVVMTRTEDVSLGAEGFDKVKDMKARLQLVRDNPDCLFISIHLNKFTQSRYWGAQVFYSSNNPESQLLAESIQRSIQTRLQPDNSRAVKVGDSNSYLLKNAEPPAVIVECGFLSNAEELALLKTEEYRAKVAYCLYLGAMEFEMERQSPAVPPHSAAAAAD